MTVRERDMHEEEKEGFSWASIQWKKAAAVAIWFIGVWCTKQVTADFFPSYVDWAAAFLVQAALTFAESPIWRRRSYNYYAKSWEVRPFGLFNLGALVIDNLLNMVGMWYFVRVMHTTAPAKTIAEMFKFEPQPMTGFWAFATCFIIGLFVCAVPEKLFYDD